MKAHKSKTRSVNQHARLRTRPDHYVSEMEGAGRNVKPGERALILCMPITHRRRDEETDNGDGSNGEHTFTSFMHKARWFVISQTIGKEFAPPVMPLWDADRALAALDIEEIPFTDPGGNCQVQKRKGATLFGLSRLIFIGYCPHPSNHLTEGFTNRLDEPNYIRPLPLLVKRIKPK